MRIIRVDDQKEHWYGELDGDAVHRLDGELFTELRRTGAVYQADSVNLGAPVSPPHVLITMGGFLPAGVDHMPEGSVPWLLPKITSSIGGPNSTAVAPPGIDRLWAEVELAVVIGKQVRSASLQEAEDAIFGYCCFNDLTAPEYVFEDVDQRRLSSAIDSFCGKSAETFAVLGPCITTDLTEAEIAAGIKLTTMVNGKLAAESSTRGKKYPITTWVQHASRFTTLKPGDVIALGTPAPCEIRVGDVVEVAVEGIGSLCTQIESWQPEAILQ